MKLRSYKIRFYLLIGAIPILIVLCWKLAVSQTVESYRNLDQLRISINQYSDPDRTLEVLYNELAIIQENVEADPEKVDEHLMDAVSKNIKRFRIRLEEFPETHSFNSNSFKVQTFRLRFSGRYSDLLRFIHFAEYEINSCQIVSVGFQRKVHRKTGEKLFMDLYFQSVYKTK